MLKLLLTDSYQKKAKKFFAKNPTVLNSYEKTLKLLCINPRHPSLRLHKLKRNLEGLFSVSINISYRLLIYFIFKDDQIVPVDIGSHDEVY
ncbi:type II toxin-antitoxin system RelE/ParE family toxin [Candidatus Peregrinibacteria bacterium]|nr:MAG: type II toxin-antitoxin system RelE/ParE family toxin [Candidatus Peregrinibacteria bacterium]